MEAFDNAKVDPQRLKKLNERIGPPEVIFQLPLELSLLFISPTCILFKSKISILFNEIQIFKLLSSSTLIFLIACFHQFFLIVEIECSIKRLFRYHFYLLDGI